MTREPDSAPALLLCPGGPEDVPGVCAIGQSSIQGHVAPGVLRARMDRQPGVLTYVRGVASGPILGYSITYWLTGGALDRIQSGEIQSGADLLLDDLALPSAPVAACYLGMIWRARERDQSPRPSPATALLLRDLQTQCLRRAVTVLVARPASPAGRRLLESMGMRPIGRESHGLWVGEMPGAPGNG